jgi:hypothetical protein
MRVKQQQVVVVDDVAVSAVEILRSEISIHSIIISHVICRMPPNGIWYRSVDSTLPKRKRKKRGRRGAAVNLSLLNERNETMKNYKIAIKRVDMARKNYSFGSVIDDDGKIEYLDVMGV